MLAGTGGTGLIRQLAEISARTRIVVLLAYHDDARLFTALQARGLAPPGGCGYQPIMPICGLSCCHCCS